MTYTSSKGLRDLEYAKFGTIQAGSLDAINVVVASGLSTGLPISHIGTGSMVLYGTSGTTIIALRCTSDGVLFTSGT